MSMETIITTKLPLTRRVKIVRNKMYLSIPWRERCLDWLYMWNGGSVGNCSGQNNTTRHLYIFRWHIMTVQFNEWHDRSHEERANEYLKKWGECEKELRGLLLLQIGDEVPSPELRKLLKRSLGISLNIIASKNSQLTVPDSMI